MKHLDLFSGIGGFKLAAEWAVIATGNAIVPQVAYEIMKAIFSDNVSSRR